MKLTRGRRLYRHTDYPYRYLINSTNLIYMYQLADLRYGITIAKAHNPIVRDHPLYLGRFEFLKIELDRWAGTIEQTLRRAIETGQTLVVFCGGLLDGQQRDAPTDPAGYPPLHWAAELPPPPVHPGPRPEPTADRYARPPHPQANGIWVYTLDGEHP